EPAMRLYVKRYRRSHRGWTVDSEARGLSARLTRWALRSASAAIGALLLAVLTAAAAGAQTADLAVTQNSTPNPAAAGDLVNVTITVTNNGPSAASNVAMVDLL